MHLIELTEKLNQIGLAIDQVDSNTLWRMVLDAQDCALEMQQETVEQLRRDSRHMFISPEFEIGLQFRLGFRVLPLGSFEPH